MNCLLYPRFYNFIQIFLYLRNALENVRLKKLLLNVKLFISVITFIPPVTSERRFVGFRGSICSVLPVNKLGTLASIDLISRHFPVNVGYILSFSLYFSVVSKYQHLL